MEKDLTYPVRLNRYLALLGHCSRREADTLITQGLVTLNGVRAELGSLVKEHDKVVLNTKKKNALKQHVYLAYNKPRGIVTHSPKEDQEDIKGAAKLPAGVFPVGRLDRDSHGLIILTNDGRVTDRLLHPTREHEKEYVVTVDKPVTPMFLRLMSQPVKLEDFTTKPCRAMKLGKNNFRIILTEGKKHQIRRMCAALGWTTLDLKRVRVLNIELGSLKMGSNRKISGSELDIFLHKLGILEQ